MTERIQWTYTHHLNGVSTTEITKKGVLIGKVRHTRRHWEKLGAVQMARVRFDGNKGLSTVPYGELFFVEPRPAKEEANANHNRNP